MKEKFSNDTEILYIGGQIQGETMHPEAPAIYPSIKKAAFVRVDREE